MPKEVFGPNYKYLDRKDVLTYEEIERVARVLAGEGVRKVRLTGGEPLVRHQIERLVEMLAGIPGIEDLTLTTNGSRLSREKARSLRDAGLDRITVSLDAIDDATFAAINDVSYRVAPVLEAIDVAAEEGLGPVKVNMVVKRGLNDHQVLPMVRHFRGTGHILRFIEFMDVSSSNGWCMDHVVPAQEIIRTIDAEFPMEPANPNYHGEVAKRWRYLDGSGEVGLITSVTQAFCSTCTRIRLSAQGKLYTCLFAETGHDVRGLLRSDASDDALRQEISALWSRRADRYSEIRTAETSASRSRIEMSYIGG